MPMNTGTLTIDDLLAVTNQPAAEFGLDAIQDVLQADLDTHNAIVQEMVGDLCEITTDNQRIYGASEENEMVEVDEFGRAPTQGTKTNPEVAFPLRRFQYAIGWTELFFKQASPADLAKATQGAEKAHLRRLTNEIKAAVYRPTNYVFNDHLVKKLNLNIKAFTNADGMVMPDGPNGEKWDPNTHTHYTAAAALDVNNILAIIDHVVEHDHGSMLKLYINRANEQAFRGLSGFEGYHDPRITLGTHTNQVGERLDITRVDNRAIGLLGAAEVWVKPWAQAGYAFVTDLDDEGKPLAFRQREATSLQGLQIAAQFEAFPLVAEIMMAEFGIGVWTRTNGAVHQFTNATYQSPV